MKAVSYNRSVAAGRNVALPVGQARRALLRGTIRPCSAAITSPGVAVQQALEWAAVNKVATDKVMVADDVASGTPMLVAARDLPAGEAIMSIPDSAWLTPAALASTPIGPLVSGLEPWLQIALGLLAERSQGNGPAAGRAGYIASLPAALDSPLFWSQEELELLQGTQMLDSVLGYKQFFAEQFAVLQEQLFVPQRAAFPPQSYDYASFVWAIATVRSRLHAPLDADTVALVPLADAVPHRRDGNVTWRLRRSGLLGKGQTLVVEAARPLRKGEGLAMDYGPGKLDGAVLLDYGVLDASSPRGGYTLTLTLPSEDRYYDDKADILGRAGLGTSATFSIVRGQEPAAEMMGFLRLMQLTGNDCFLLESIFEAEVWDFMCQPVSPDNEAAVCGAMVEGASEALAGYGGSIEDDIAALRGTAGGRTEAALRVRLGEREALDGLLAFFEGRAADLPALEYYQERRLKRLGLVDDEGRTTYDSFFRDGIA